MPIAPEPSKTAELATDVVEPAEVAMDNVEAVAEPVVDAEAREGLEWRVVQWLDMQVCTFLIQAAAYLL